MKAYSIEFAYPTSENAELLGVPETGGYHVSCTMRREDGSYVTFIPVQASGDVFSRRDDPDLLSLIDEFRQEASRQASA